MAAVNKLISQKDAIIGQFDLALRTAFCTTALETERDEPSLWCALLDFVTVYSKEDVRFTFKDGTEIRA